MEQLLLQIILNCRELTECRCRISHRCGSFSLLPPIGWASWAKAVLGTSGPPLESRTQTEQLRGMLWQVCIAFQHLVGPHCPQSVEHVCVSPLVITSSTFHTLVINISWLNVRLAWMPSGLIAPDIYHKQSGGKSRTELLSVLHRWWPHDNNALKKKKNRTFREFAN